MNYVARFAAAGLCAGFVLLPLHANAQSPEEIIGGIVEDLIKGRPIEPPKITPPPTIDVLGSLRVINESHWDAVAFVTLNNGRRITRTIRPGTTDTWRGLPGGRQGYVSVRNRSTSFRIPGNGLLTLTVMLDGRIVRGRPPTGPPIVDPPIIGPPIIEPPPRPTEPGPSTGPVGPNPPPPLRLATPAPNNNLPRLAFNRLPEQATMELSRASNQDVEALLEGLGTAAEARVGKLGGELANAGIEPDATESLTQCVASGNVAQLSELMNELSPGALRSEADLRTKLTALTSFFNQFNALKGEFDSGASYVKMAPYVGELKQQGTNLGVDELSASMTALQQHLMIRDAINKASDTIELNVGGPSIPEGPVNVIRHPRVHAGTTFIAGGETILVGKNGGEIEILRTTFPIAMEVPMASAQEPLPDWDDPQLIRGVIVHNPPEHQTALNYQLNDRPVRLESGTEQFLESAAKLIIEFSRGPNLPTARYNIGKAGTYRFSAEKDGWNLRRISFEVEMNNPPTGLTFNYLVDGEPFLLEPGEHRKHKSGHPIVVQFDRGNGTRTSSKLVADKLSLYVALNPSTRDWDLYPEPYDGGISPPQGMSFALLNLEDFIKTRQTILFDFGEATGLAPVTSDNLLEALQSAQ